MLEELTSKCFKLAAHLGVQIHRLRRDLPLRHYRPRQRFQQPVGSALRHQDRRVDERCSHSVDFGN